MGFHGFPEGDGFHGFPWVTNATVTIVFHICINGFPWVSKSIHGMETRGVFTRDKVEDELEDLKTLPVGHLDDLHVC